MSATDQERQKWAEQLHDLASLIDGMADALDEDDGILGSIAGEGIANHLPALPRHIRHLFMDYLSDEAAAGHATDLRYIAAQEQAA